MGYNLTTMITIKFSSEEKSLEVKEGTLPLDLIENFSGDRERIMAVKVNNLITSLTKPLRINCTVEAVYSTSNDGAEVYRRSLCFMMAAAASKLFPTARLLIAHSLGYGYYYTVEKSTPITKDEIAALKAEMDSLVRQDLPITRELVSYTEAIELFEKEGLKESRKQLEYNCPAKIVINSLKDFSDLDFGPLVDRTGKLQVFELTPYDEGLLLRFPFPKEVDKVPEFKDSPKIFEIFKKYKEWGRKLGITSTASINELVAKRKINDFIDITETFQNHTFADVASMIYERGNVKVVLIAGPSSSGKTTSAKKMALQLQALGYNPKVISLDCYYVGRDRNPKDENGNYDYECLEALDIDLLNQNLIDLFAGKDVAIPSYNFDLGQRYYTGEKMHLDENDILIMEGIHGLNDKLTPLIKPEFKFKIYLSALTQLNLDDHNRISTSDNRLIRRIVRDSRFRGKSAAETIGMWDSVQRGERKHIFPFQNNADAVLNTALDYELPVLKVYVEPLLRMVKPTQTEYSTASRLLDFLSYFSPVPEDYIPKQSIVREFIGGSSFHY